MARFNQDIYNAIINMGGSPASAMNAARAKRPGRAFRRFQSAFVPPTPAPVAAPTPPPMPTQQQYQAPVQAQTTIASVGQGVQPAKPKRKNTLASLRIKRDRPRVNTSLGTSYATGTGLNIGGLA